LAADKQPNEKGALREDRAFFYCRQSQKITVGASSARDDRKDNAYIQAARVNVGVHREQSSLLQGYVFTDSFSQAKKRATEVAQNALRAHYIHKELRLLPLVRILPDKKSEPCKKYKHEADSQHPGDHHVVEKHDASPVPALLR
jgi:hypothetical protein